MASEKNNYNFRKQISTQCGLNLTTKHLNMQPSVRNNAEIGFEILKNRVNDASRRHIQRWRATINNPSMMSNRLLDEGREPMKQKELSTAKKLLQNTLKLKDKSKEL